jgi:hypothetical protein
MSWISAKARFSLARPMKDLAMRGPATRMAPVTMVMMPSGTMAKIRWSTQVRLSLVNWVANCSPNRAKTLAFPGQR